MFIYILVLFKALFKALKQNLKNIIQNQISEQHVFPNFFFELLCAKDKFSELLFRTSFSNFFSELLFLFKVVVRSSSVFERSMFTLRAETLPGGLKYCLAGCKIAWRAAVLPGGLKYRLAQWLRIEYLFMISMLWAEILPVCI
jgi:hypothetical protein